jgi:hypothetical protein
MQIEMLTIPGFKRILCRFWQYKEGGAIIECPAWGSSMYAFSWADGSMKQGSLKGPSVQITFLVLLTAEYQSKMNTLFTCDKKNAALSKSLNQQ